jgi:hypothetical protein
MYKSPPDPHPRRDEGREDLFLLNDVTIGLVLVVDFIGGFEILDTLNRFIVRVEAIKLYAHTSMLYNKHFTHLLPLAKIAAVVCCDYIIPYFGIKRYQ